REAAAGQAADPRQGVDRRPAGARLGRGQLGCAGQRVAAEAQPDRVDCPVELEVLCLHLAWASREDAGGSGGALTISNNCSLCQGFSSLPYMWSRSWGAVERKLPCGLWD